MAQLIHQHSTLVRAPDGTQYRARTYGEARADGTWHAWIELSPIGGDSAVLRTDQETSQPDRKAVEYWAGGLEAVYLEGALARARAGRKPASAPAAASRTQGSAHPRDA
jgi:hypothetical protein